MGSWESRNNEVRSKQSISEEEGENIYPNWADDQQGCLEGDSVFTASSETNELCFGLVTIEMDDGCHYRNHHTNASAFLEDLQWCVYTYIKKLEDSGQTVQQRTPPLLQKIKNSKM